MLHQPKFFSIFLTFAPSPKPGASSFLISYASNKNLALRTYDGIPNTMRLKIKKSIYDITGHSSIAPLITCRSAPAAAQS